MSAAVGSSSRMLAVTWRVWMISSNGMGRVLSGGIGIGIRCVICAINGLELELPGVAVVALQSKDFADQTATRFALHMDHVIDGLADLRFNVLEGRLGVAAKNEIGKSAERLCRGIGVDRGERSGVAG